MNNRAAVERVRLLVDESKMADRLVAGMGRDPKGRKTCPETVRLLLIGLLLSIEENKSCTITSAYHALTERMDITDQIRLGVKVGPGPRDFVKRDRLYYAADMLSSRLAYGRSVEFELTVDERDRRHSVLIDACNALLDYTAEATEVDDNQIAIDATAIWAWLRGKFYPKPTAEEIASQSDEIFRDGFIELASATVAKGALKGVDDLEGIVVTNDPEKLKGGDPDAAWCGATAKNGGMARFYGTYAHALVQVPPIKIKYDRDARAPIVRRIEVTRSTDDVVDVTLRLLDSLGQDVKTILVDRHYSYKGFVRWQQALIQRGIRQILDLRSNDHKVLRHPESTYVDGFAHCPAMPEEYFEMKRPDQFGTQEQHKAFAEQMEQRKNFAHVVLNQMDEQGRMKLRCPAREFLVACPLYRPSMEVAAELGLTIVNTDLLQLEPGQEPARCCTQNSFRVTLPESAAKLNQIHYWGSIAWYRVYGLRTHVEGVFGNLKNPRTENLRRGTIQKSGLVWTQLMVTLIAASYNVRMIRSRHERLAFDPIEHPLLAPDEESVTHFSLTPELEAWMFNNCVNEMMTEIDSKVKLETGRSLRFATKEEVVGSSEQLALNEAPNLANE